MSKRPLIPRRLLGLLLVTVALGACGSDAGSSSDDTPTTDTWQTATPDTPTGDAVAGPVSCPEGYATLTMTVDDSHNQTYEAGELLWTGSFAFDAATNTVTYATAWQPTDGPYPPLWDDGPVSAGGHEPEGATAGDHVFGVSVCYLAEQDRLLAYGVLNDDLRWIWLGPNGLLDVPAGSTETFAAEGLVIEAHGDRDVEVTLDLGALHPDYATIGLDTHAIYLKGSLNAWTPVQLLDNGALGDAEAGDGILTYRHSHYAHGHIGLLRPGQEAQFVFVFAMGDLDPDLAAEYKVGGEASPEGTTARALCLAGWEDAEVFMSPDSKGTTLNTTLVVCPEDPDTPLAGGPDPEDCGPDAPCPVGQICADGTCVDEATPACDADTPCPEGQVCVTGQCEAESPADCEATSCPDGEVCVDGACVAEPEGDCSDQVPCLGADEVCLAGACVVPESSPELVLVMPAVGSELGGTVVTLHGSGFLADATVTFDGAPGGVISVSEAEIQVTTPAHAPGTVDVTVTNPDGGYSTYPGGFTYAEAGSAPVVTGVDPASGPSSGGTPTLVIGANFVPGATVLFGAATAPWAEVSADGFSLTTETPEAPLGPVSVTVINPDGQQGSLADAFTYSPDVPDWSQLDGPATLSVIADVESVTLSAQVWEPELTEFEGLGFGIVAEAGYGAVNTSPVDDATWTWSPATFSHDLDNNDVWTGTFTVPEGTWAATMRFSLGSEGAWLVSDLDGTLNGTTVDQLVTIEASGAPDVWIGAVTPPTSWPLGGMTIGLSGAGLGPDCTLTVDGEATPTEWSEPATLTFTAPAQDPGDASLSVDCPLGTATATLTYATSWDGALDEWPEGVSNATNTLPSEWSETNTLSELRLATDGVHLIVGIEGHAFGDGAANAIVVYIDTDLGAGTGLKATGSLTDSNHPVEEALGGALQLTAPGFGAEVALATLDMTGYTPGVDEPAATLAGWRGLAPADDLPWLLDGAIYTTESALEALIPLADLFGEPTGQEHNLGFIVRIADATGEFLADQALPEGVGGEAYELAPSAAGFKLTY